MISTIILTHNEESSVAATLKSVAWTDEALVIDDCSTDKTVAIAQRAGARVFTRALNGDLAAQRNFGLEMASGNWVLFVDADELVTKALMEEILQKIEDEPTVHGYYFRRKDFFLGRYLDHGETGEIRLLRLGRKGSGLWKRKVHETWEIRGTARSLTNPLEHRSHESIKQFIQKINAWTEIDAGELAKEGKDFSYFVLLAYPPVKFVVSYFGKLGFLDGFPGFVMAFMMSLYSLIVRVKQFERRT